MSLSKLEYVIRSFFIDRSVKRQKALGFDISEVDGNIIELASYYAKKSEFETSLFLLKKIQEKAHRSVF